MRSCRKIKTGMKKKRANKPQSKAFHVFDITGQSVLAAIPRTIGLAAAQCVEIDYSIGISQGQKIRMEIIVRITGSPRNKDKRFSCALTFIPELRSFNGYIVALG